MTFVSVTQAFNTTTSMGRLTLNILLSFAQFEREVIGERIRDKVAASRARGMWMGGKVPLGYDVRDRKLVVNEAEAARVRRVFELFAETGSGVETARRLREEGVDQQVGAAAGQGRRLQAAATTAPTSGRSRTRGKVYPGEHEAIVPRELWDRAHAVLQESPRARANQNRNADAGAAEGADLRRGRAGAVADALPRGGGGSTATTSAQRVLKGDAAAGDDGIVRRVSAAEIEAAVVDQVRALLRQPEVVVGTWLAARAEAPDLTEARDARSAGAAGPAVGRAVPGRAGAHRAAAGGAGGGRRRPAPTSGSGSRGWRAWCATWAPVRPTRWGRRHDDGGQHHGPGAAGHPPASGAEDGRHAGGRREPGARPHAAPIRRW